MRRTLVLVAVIGGAVGAADPPAGFDPADVTKTHAWLVREKAALPAVPAGNELAAKRAEDAFQKTLDAITGKPVRWVVSVSGVDREGKVGVQPVADAPAAEALPREKAARGEIPARRATRNVLRLNNGPLAERRGGFGDPGAAGNHFPPKQDGEWVAKLATGDKVVLTGTVLSAHLGTGAGTRGAAGGGAWGGTGLGTTTGFVICIKDGAVEPAPAP
jgi:hypothetical protein